MKILAVSGSPRKKGNTAALINEALIPFIDAGVECEIIHLDDYDFKDCNGCERCRETYRCAVDDGMQKLYPLIEEAEAVILGSPTYFYNITAKMKAFIDRLYCFEIFHDNDRSVWMSLNEAAGIKYAAVIAVCEQNNKEDMGFTAEAMSMPLEALGYRVVSTVKALHLFKQGEACGNNAALNDARGAGEKLLKTLQLRGKVMGKGNL
jgi:multimeric flavodoxin WrbA